MARLRGAASGRCAPRARGLTAALAPEPNIIAASGAIFLLGLGENHWRRFVPKYLEALGAPVIATGQFGTTEDILDGVYQYPGGASGNPGEGDDERGEAAITGDFVMTASEVNPVIRALRESGIQIAALHSHMLTESPRLSFMHFWANDAIKLAHGLRTAFEKMHVKAVS